jgi:sugar O-acyltransferase (sialic acid O-acetyltransferase NeuD family)
VNIYLYGAGGFGREIYDSMLESNLTSTIQSITFINDFRGVEDRLLGQRLITFDEVLVLESDNSKFLITVGSPESRSLLRSKLDLNNLQLAQFVSNESYISPSAQLSLGVIVSKGVTIANNAIVGKNAAINVNSIVGHDVTIGENCSISSQVNIGGGSRVGDGSYIGMGSLIREGVKIGENSVIGMGSVVFEDIPSGVVAVGNPARVVKRNDSGVSFRNSNSG